MLSGWSLPQKVPTGKSPTLHNHQDTSMLVIPVTVSGARIVTAAVSGNFTANTHWPAVSLAWSPDPFTIATTTVIKIITDAVSPTTAVIISGALGEPTHKKPTQLFINGKSNGRLRLRAASPTK